MLRVCVCLCVVSVGKMSAVSVGWKRHIVLIKIHGATHGYDSLADSISPLC